MDADQQLQDSIQQGEQTGQVVQNAGLLQSQKRNAFAHLSQRIHAKIGAEFSKYCDQLSHFGWVQFFQPTLQQP